MRSIATIGLVLALTAGAGLLAQEGDEDEATDSGESSQPAPPTPPANTDVSFAPTEDVAADTAVAFPTDI